MQACGKRGFKGFSVCGYWWIWLPSQNRILKVGPFSERIFQANFRFGVEISNFQLLGCVKAEKLSFLEGWFFVCSYWWIWLPSHVWFSNVRPFLERIFRADFRFGVEISNFQLLGCLKAANLSFLEGWFFVCGPGKAVISINNCTQKISLLKRRVFQLLHTLKYGNGHIPIKRQVSKALLTLLSHCAGW